MFRGRVVHLTGIKGTGMAAIAEVLSSEHAVVSGSDVAETFYTDELLAKVGVSPRVGFDAVHVPENANLLVYSAAYGPENPERREAERRGIPQMSYAEVLGTLSRSRLSLGVSGVHGKTTTTAMLGTLVSETDLPVTVIVGSAVPSFGGSATLCLGNELLIAETCEYRRHFLEFSPAVAIVTGVEPDHQDYFRDYQDIRDAFVEYGNSLAKEGALVYCADDLGAREVARTVSRDRPDINIVPYGFHADGPWRCTHLETGSGVQRFTLGMSDEPWTLRVPGRHMIANATAAVAALTELLHRYGRSARSLSWEEWRAGLSRFQGTRRRSELIARVGGITIIDDYGHHPTAIAKTLAGYREFYPDSRLVVDFMSHTYSRTAALLDQFGPAFREADLLVLNDIYASARETNQTGLTGEAFYRKLVEVCRTVWYEPDFERAARRIEGELRPGDVFITMGAGDNFRIGHRVKALLESRFGGGDDA